jgi:hypothetical protein
VFASSLPLYLVGAAFWTVGEVVGFPVAGHLVTAEPRRRRLAAVAAAGVQGDHTPRV